LWHLILAYFSGKSVADLVGRSRIRGGRGRGLKETHHQKKKQKKENKKL
jgi:hypothetical protein